MARLAPRRLCDRAMRVGLVVISSAFLAWSASRAVSGFVAPAPGEYTYTIRASTSFGRNVAAESAEVWLVDVIADGRPLARSALRLTGDWDDRGWALQHRADSPATISFRAGRATAVFLTSRWSGIVHVEGEHDAGIDLDLFHPERTRTSVAAVDLDGGHAIRSGRTETQPIARIAALFVALALLAWLVGAWTTSSATELWTVGYLFALHAIVWLTQAIGYNSDAHGYFEGGTQFRQGEISYFPPGYPIFLGVVQNAFPEHAGLAITAIQHVMIVLALFALTRIVRRIFPADVATAALLVTGSVGPTLILPQMLFAENVAFFGMAATLWFVVDAPRRRRALDVIAGVCAGWATLARMVPIVALPGALLLIIAAGQRWTLALKRTALVVLVALAMVAAAAGWIWVHSGVFGVADSQGLHLFNRVVAEQGLVDTDGAATRRLVTLTGVQTLRGLPHWDVTPLLAARGLNYAATESLFRDVAGEAIRRYPWRFVRYSLGMTWREYAASPMTLAPQAAAADVQIPAIDASPPLGVRASSLLWRSDLDAAFDAIWPILLWAPVVGLVLAWRLPSPQTYMALVLIPAAYLGATSLVEYFLERYVIAVVPFALIASPAPLVAVGYWWRAPLATTDPRIHCATVVQSEMVR